MDVQPLNQNLDSVFASTTFYIDFYQRDYKWTNEPVNRLLDDVFYKFNQEYESNKELDVNEDIITSNYSWYYLNTYVTNKVGGKTYVVDGQQRLTTLTLMLIKLRHLTKVYKSELSGWIEAKIAGKSGFKNNYWMYHENHIKCLEELFDGEKDLKEVDTSSGITAVNMVKNYDVISKYLDKEIKTKHKFETFTFYFLHRLVLINLTVEQTDVPMVFEVINDRGVRLKPFEILKGKLLGQIDKQELETGKYNELWETQINAINDHFEDEADEFFRYYLKAKFANNRKEGHVFDGDYHREMFSNGMKDKLKLKHNPSGVKEFLKNSFKYYSDLYLKILGFYRNLKEEQPYIYFNYLNERAGQFMLILSACQLNDLNEDEKIKAISYEVDRAFALLQLQNCYDSNAFTEMEYKVSSEIRGKDMSEYRAVFDKFLMEQIGASRSAEVVKPIQYSYFKTTG
ncbi:MAG TPA: DUF262 domain-containing protein, partial [Bacteroidales bacterium]|nr:DUF262 domain-containing protein [Bacteroidales bacterium]